MIRTVDIPPGTNVEASGITMEVIEGRVELDRSGVAGGSLRFVYPPADPTVPTILRVGTLTFDATMTPEGLAFFGELLDGAWRREWYRDPDSAWWDR